MSDVSGGDYSYRLGGLCGRNYEGTIIDCYATGVVSGTDGLGGLCGSNSATISSCFWDVETSGQTTSHGGLGLQTIQMQQMTYFGFNGWENSDWRINDGNDYPRLVWENSGGEVIVVPEVNLAGEGTEENPWQIADVNDLMLVMIGTYFWNKDYILTNDINLTGLTSGRIGYDRSNCFTGSFNGKGFIISNLTLDMSSSDYVGLFGSIGIGGEIRNLGIEDVNVRGRDYVGGLCGENYCGTIMNCYVMVSVNGDYALGGLCGRNYEGTITNCYATGGIIGDNDLVLCL
jgi:hypothetical protein